MVSVVGIRVSDESLVDVGGIVLTIRHYGFYIITHVFFSLQCLGEKGNRPREKLIRWMQPGSSFARPVPATGRAASIWARAVHLS